MNAEQFAYWLRGAVESRNFDNITLEDAKALLKSIQDHSALPFKKVTPELSKKDQGLNDLIKKSIENQKIEPSGVKITPLPYHPTPFPNPSRPYDYDKPNYWLDGRPGYKPGELYC